MRRNALKLAIIMGALVCLLTSVANAQDISGSGLFDQEEYSLYGYVSHALNLTADNSGNVLYLRLKGDWDPGANLAFHLEFYSDNRTGNQHPDYLSGLLGGAVKEGGATTNQTLNIDHLWGMANLGNLDVQFGKIPIGWGTGYAFNPTAKTHLVSFLEDTTEETPGTLAILASYTVNDRTGLQGYLAFEDRRRWSNPAAGKWEHLPYGVKAQKVVGGFDFSVSWCKEVSYGERLKEYQQEYYLGGDFVGAVGNFGVYGEAALHFPCNAEGTAFNFSGHKVAELLELCAGFDYPFSSWDLITRMEYYHQGRGESDQAKYDLWQSLSEGRALLAADYLVVSLEKVFADYYNFTVGSLINLNDGSFLLLPELAYDVAENWQVLIGALFPCGAKGSEFNGTWDLPGRPVELLRPSIYLSTKLSF